MGVTRESIKTLTELQWSFVICSRYPANAMRDEQLLIQAKDLATFLIEITPGGESDWEVFERKRTTPITRRLQIARRWQSNGIKIGVRGEPFIPGYHTTVQFRDILRLLSSYGIKSYNTYNLHINEYTLKRLHGIGLDIEKIWIHNQDKYWKPIQRKLCQIAEEENILLGCPDFVNVPKGWKSRSNTCCGVDVPQPFLFNTHHWKMCLQKGMSPQNCLDSSWEGIGTENDLMLAKTILFDTSTEHYTMKDAEL
jgi:hypothetical protein